MSNEADLQESFEYGLLFFKDFLEILTMEPFEQCEAWGNYNVAWEMVADLKREGHIISTFECSYLSEHQKQEVIRFIHSLEKIPETLLIEATTANANLLAMSDSVWIPIRKSAINLITVLETAFARNKQYFSS